MLNSILFGSLWFFIGTIIGGGLVTIAYDELITDMMKALTEAHDELLYWRSRDTSNKFDCGEVEDYD